MAEDSTRSRPYSVSYANPSIEPGDIVIAVMGVTGAGKTTFIQHFTKDSLEIGHGLESCTRNVSIHKCRLPNGTKLFLVDTPGFDDTYRSDTQILSELADWLNAAYNHEVLLTGIVYLHRILDVRMAGSAMKNLRMFKKLCGEDGLPSVVLATTFWGNVSQQEGEQREHQLKTRDDFWSVMIRKGSRVFRQDRAGASALSIIQYLVRKGRKTTLDIQKQMVDERMTLDQTAAGKEVQAELVAQRREYEERLQALYKDMSEALAKKDRDHQDEIRKYKKEIDRKMRRQKEDMMLIKSDEEDLRKRIEDEVYERLKRVRRCVVM